MGEYTSMKNNLGIMEDTYIKVHQIMLVKKLLGKKERENSKRYTI